MSTAHATREKKGPGNDIILSTAQADVTTLLATPEGVAAAFLAGYRPATREAYARDLHAWGAFLERIAADPLEARRVHVDAFVRDAEDAGVAPATVARRLAALAGFYGYALAEGVIDRSPVASVRRPRVSDESPRLGLDRDGLRALLGAAEASSDRDNALVTLLVLSGLRITEALQTDVRDLGTERGHRTLTITRKGAKRQTIALAPRTAAALDTLIAGREDGPIFVTRTGRRLDRFAARKAVARLAAAAGVTTTVSPHTLRHGFVTAALDAKVPLRDVQDAAGHADPRTTRRYDRGRHALDRAATYAVATHLAA